MVVKTQPLHDPHTPHTHPSNEAFLSSTLLLHLTSVFFYLPGTSNIAQPKDLCPSLISPRIFACSRLTGHHWLRRVEPLETRRPCLCFAKVSVKMSRNACFVSSRAASLLVWKWHRRGARLRHPRLSTTRPGEIEKLQVHTGMPMSKYREEIYKGRR